MKTEESSTNLASATTGESLTTSTHIDDASPSIILHSDWIIIENNFGTSEEDVNMKKRNREEFDFVKEIGQGAYGKVFLGKDKLTDKMVAIKSVNKEYILKIGKKRHVYREKRLLSELQHPFIIKLISTFQVTILSLFLILKLKIG